MTTGAEVGVLAGLVRGAAADVPGGLAGWTVEVMGRLGAVGAGLLVALETLVPPIPSEVVLPAAGFAASRGTLSLTAALLWTTAGSVLGAVVLHRVGVLLGRERVLAVWTRVPLLDAGDFLRGEAWFARHGRKAVLLGRLVPVVRSLVSLPAGVERMPLPTFVLLTAAGSAVWNTLLIGAGYTLGEQWHRVEPVVGWLQRAVLLVAVLAAVVWCVRRLRRRRRTGRRARSGTA